MSGNGGLRLETMSRPMYRRAHDAIAGQAERVERAAGHLRERAERLLHVVKHHMGRRACHGYKIANACNTGAPQ